MICDEPSAAGWCTGGSWNRARVRAPQAQRYRHHLACLRTPAAERPRISGCRPRPPEVGSAGTAFAH